MQRLRWLRISRRPALIAELDLRRAALLTAVDRALAQRWVDSRAAALAEVDGEIAHLEGGRRVS